MRNYNIFIYLGYHLAPHDQSFSSYSGYPSKMPFVLSAGPELKKMPFFSSSSGLFISATFLASSGVSYHDGGRPGLIGTFTASALSAPPLFGSSGQKTVLKYSTLKLTFSSIPSMCLSASSWLILLSCTALFLQFMRFNRTFFSQTTYFTMLSMVLGSFALPVASAWSTYVSCCTFVGYCFRRFYPVEARTSQQANSFFRSTGMR